jgi:hypothetical protein
VTERWKLVIPIARIAKTTGQYLSRRREGDHAASKINMEDDKSRGARE